MVTRSIPAGFFKAGCLALLDEVAEGNVELVVTKRGKPVARVVPVLERRAQEDAILGRLRGRMQKPLGRRADLVKPSSALARWKLTPSSR